VWILRLAVLAAGLATVPAATAPAAPWVDLRNEFLLRIEGAPNVGLDGAANAGDVNGDGVPDALVSAVGSPSTIYLVYGRRDTWRVRLPVGGRTSTQGYRMVREGQQNTAAPAVNAGDVNGDNVPDALIGYASTEGPVGEAYVVFGQRTPAPRTIDLAALTPPEGYTIEGAPGDFTGTAVANAGDVNGDGIPDALIGSPGELGAPGSVYVVYGRRPAPQAPIDLEKLAPSEGYRVGGADGDGLGQALANAGDVNGDGVPDGLLGAESADHSFADSGSAYVVYGQRSSSPQTIELSAPGARAYRIDGPSAFALAASAVDNAGDVNGDRVPDALVGAPGQANALIGSAYVVYGHAVPPAAAIELNRLTAADGYRIADSRQASGAGTAVAGLGDVSGDGVPDALVGAIGARFRGGAGAAYVVYGQRTAAPAAVDLAGLKAREGYAAGGVPSAAAGWGVADAGDVNGDGTEEAWVMAPNYAPTATTAGAALLIGRPRPTAQPQTSRAVVGRERTAVLQVSCSAPVGARCVGALQIRRGRDILASGGFSARPGQRAVVRLRLSPRVAAQLRRRGRLRVLGWAVTAAQPPAPAVVRRRPLVLVARTG
jgi:hypothetical protein